MGDEVPAEGWGQKPCSQRVGDETADNALIVVAGGPAHQLQLRPLLHPLLQTNPPCLGGTEDTADNLWGNPHHRHNSFDHSLDLEEADNRNSYVTEILNNSAAGNGRSNSYAVRAGSYY